MNQRPEKTIVQAWARLVRAEQATMSKIENQLKRAGLPSLAWYDVLLELSRDARSMLRPVELERRLLLTQYSTSRLIDRMEKAGAVERRACPEDGRGQLVAITARGRDLQRQMWDIYGQAIAELVGAKLSRNEAVTLYEILGRLI